MNRRAWILMALLAALWGASYLFIKVALEDGVAPVFIVFARIALGALVLVPLAWRAGALPAMRGLAGPVAFVAIVQVVLPFLLITFGERRIPSSLTGILVSSAPIFTALIAVRYDDDERPHGIAIAGVAMGIVGVVLLFGVDLRGDSAAVAGGLMVLLASVGYAIGSLYLKHRLRGVPAVGVAAMTMVTGTLVLAPLALLALPTEGLAPKAIGSLLALGAGGTGIAFAIYYTLIAEIGPGRASLVAYIAPGFAVFYGVALLSESITAGTIAGLGLILLGSWIAAEGRLPGRARATTVAPLEPPPDAEPSPHVESSPHVDSSPHAERAPDAERARDAEPPPDAEPSPHAEPPPGAERGLAGEAPRSGEPAQLHGPTAPAARLPEPPREPA